VVAVATRVANSLGAGDERSARNSALTAFVIVQCMAVVYLIVLLVTQTSIGRIFSTDPHVIQGLSHTVPVICTIMFCSVIQQVIAAVLHGAGKQWEGSLANVIGYDCVALPAALLLAKYWRGGDDAATSLWWGVAAGVVSVFVAMVVIFAKMNWKQEVENSARRIAHHLPADYKDPLLEPSTNVSDSNGKEDPISSSADSSGSGDESPNHVADHTASGSNSADESSRLPPPSKTAAAMV